MNDPLRVLSINDCSRIGGAEKILLQLLAHLHGQHIFFGVIVPTDGPLARRIQTMNIPVIFTDIVDLKRKWLLPDAWIQARRNLQSAIGKFQPDVILAGSPWVASVLYVTRSAPGIPVVCAVHADPAPKRRSKRILLKLFGKIFSKSAALWVVVSDKLKQDLISMGIHPGRIEVIYNGVDIPDERGDIGKKNIREMFGVRPDEVLIAGAGRLHPGKGWITFCRAAAVVRKEFPKTRFIIFGEEIVSSVEHLEFTDRLRELIRELFPDGGCSLAGFEPDIAALLDEVDIFVSASEEESFGLAVLEAMAAGCPVVVSDVTGHRLLLKPAAGKTKPGFFFPVGNHEVLAEHLLFLLKNSKEREAMGKAARRKAGDWPLDPMLHRWRDLLMAVSPKGFRS